MTNESVTLVEVGPRDGLQSLSETWSVPARALLCDELSAAGLSRIEAVSFVNPARVPQMAEAELVVDALTTRDQTAYAGLALNARGIERARATRLAELRMVVVASDSFSRRNQGLTSDEAMDVVRDVAPMVHTAGQRFTVVIAAAFGCPFEGEVDPGRVADLAIAALEAGADEISLADTIGASVPAQIRDLLGRIVPSLSGTPIGLHLHNTRNTGYANALIGLEHGATILDSAIGGIGGCPFAPAATGNIATEDLVWMLERSGIATGLNLDALMHLSKTVRTEVGVAHTGALLNAERFPEVAKRGMA